MKLTANPFSVYDFLGYFLTGFVFVYLVNFGITNNVIEIETLTNLKSRYEIHELGTYDNLFIVALCYITGHVLGFISSMTIEQYNIFIYNYPSKYLLNLNVSGDGWNVYLVKGKHRKNLLRILLLLLLIPLLFVDLILGHLIGAKKYMTRSINSSLIPLVIKKIEKIYNTRILEEQDHKNEKHLIDEYFIPVYHYVVEKSDRHHKKMQNYVALYGFLRNMSLLLLIITWLFILSFECSNFKSDIFRILISASLCYVFFLGYIKFYCRYSKEVIYAAFAIE